MEQITRQSLPSFFELVSESLQMYKRKWQPLLKIILVSYIFAIGAAMVIAAEIAIVGVAALFSGKLFATVVVVLAAAADIVLLGLIGSWLAAATIVVLRDNQEVLGLGKALKRSRRYAVPLFWVSILSGLAVFWGWLFFVFPGVIFTVWFLFSRFCVVVDNEKGIGAAAKSREYARGYFWNILMLGLLGTIAMLIVYGILNVLARLPLGNLFYFAATIAIAPLPSIYLYLIFDHVKKIKGQTLLPVSRAQKNLVFWLATIGLAIIIVFTGLLIYFAPQIKNFYGTMRQEYQTQTGSEFKPLMQNPL